MIADRLGSAWIAGFAVWGVVLAGFSIADKVSGETMTAVPHLQAPQVQTVETAVPHASFDYDQGVHYWQEDRDEPAFIWPGQAAAM